jgi:hypothetical protein
VQVFGFSASRVKIEAMEQDWMSVEQIWNQPEEDWDVLDEDWVEFEDEYDATDQRWAGYTDSPEETDLDFEGEIFEDEWGKPDPGSGGFSYMAAPEPRGRLGLGFVMTCALIVGVSLSLVLYKATAGATFPALIASSAGEVAQTSDTFQSQADEDGSVSNSPGALDGMCAVSDRYPAAILQWCGLITHYANKHGIPPDLIASLIWQESGGNPAAYSRSGAVGLMQVMPRDGLAASFMCKNGPCFSTRPTIEQLKDPEFNIAYGTRMLANLLARSGSFREALRSYGPMNVGYYYADKVMGLFQTYGKSSP